MSTISLPISTGDTSLTSYMEKVSKFPYLTQEEEYKLAKEWSEEGNIDAAHKLVTSHLRLVAKIAFGYKNYGLPVLELISEGNIGLMQAVKKFEPEKGFRLSTYAMWWIKAAIQEHILHSWSLVKIGTTAAQKKLFFNLRKMKNRLQKVDNNALSPAEVTEIANELDVNEREVIDMDSRLSQSDTSLNAPILGYEDDNSEVIDTIESEAESHELIIAENQDLKRKRDLFANALKTLNEREQDIIIRRRMREQAATLEELSEKYGISRERVRQIENRAIEKLQAAVKSTESLQ